FGTETLHIVTNDNGHSGCRFGLSFTGLTVIARSSFPGALSDNDDLAITVNPVNDNPNLQPDTTSPVSYTENAAPTALFAAENVDAPLADVDQSANYAGGSIDLQITTGLVSG